MGSHTQLKEIRTVYRDADDVIMYKMEVECIDEGPLEDTGVFVFQIFNSRNPLGDIFQRVATVTDLEMYDNDRDVAIARGDEYWRNDNHILEFDDVEVATAAVRTLSDRVNTLVNNYTTYKTDFETDPSGETLNFPTSDPTIIDERKAEYEDAVTAFNTAQTNEATALTARDDATTALSDANDTLLGWQEEKDRICGGNESGEGEKVGLKPEMDDVGNAFLETYNGTGSFTWGASSNLVAFKDAVDAFYDDATAIIVGGTPNEFLRLTVTVSTPAVASDIGKEVTDGTTPGYLVAISTVSSGSQYWWIGDSSTAITGSVTITGGSGAGTIADKDSSGNNPFDGILDVLKAASTAAGAVIAAASDYISETPTAITDHVTACNEVTSTTATKLTDVTTAETSLKEKEAAYLTAQGATQAAYDVVLEKYDAVKEVCPTWSPDPPLPAQP